MRKEDLTGMRFGRWAVLGLSKKKYLNSRARGWFCQCDCGIKRIVLGSTLKNGQSKSCGCYMRERNGILIAERSITHGETRNNNVSRLYRIWCGIKQRIKDKNKSNFRWYGGRGIKLYPEWYNYSAFKLWALANNYNDALTIDRINNDGNYEPPNCRWITQSENSRKKRHNYSP